MTCGLWLRTLDETIEEDDTTSTFQDGYFLRLYTNLLSIYRYTDGTATLLGSSYNLGSNINSIWWHIKFKATGTSLQGWVSKAEGFTLDPQLTTSDSTFLSGKPGFSVRTDYYYYYLQYITSVAGIKIKIYDETEPIVEFNDDINQLLTKVWKKLE